MRLWDDMTRIDELTVDDFAGYWVTGPVTVNDLITSGNEAIVWHHTHQRYLLKTRPRLQKRLKGFGRWSRPSRTYMGLPRLRIGSKSAPPPGG